MSKVKKDDEKSATFFDYCALLFFLFLVYFPYFFILFFCIFSAFGHMLLTLAAAVGLQLPLLPEFLSTWNFDL